MQKIKLKNEIQMFLNFFFEIFMLITKLKLQTCVT